MQNEYQLGKDIQSILDPLAAFQGASRGSVQHCCRCGRYHPQVPGGGPLTGGRVPLGNNPNIPDTINLQANSGGTVTAVGTTGDLPIVNNFGVPVLYTAGQVAISVQPGQLSSFNQISSDPIVLQPVKITYFDPCYPYPPNPDTICIITGSSSPISGPQSYFGPGDDTPRGKVVSFNSDGTLT